MDFFNGSEFTETRFVSVQIPKKLSQVQSGRSEGMKMDGSESERSRERTRTHQRSVDWSPGKRNAPNIVRIFRKIYDWSTLNFISLTEFNTIPLSGPKSKNRSPEALV